MARITLELPETFIFSTDIPVRIGDINYGGHLANDAVLSIIHEARLRCLHGHGLAELNPDGIGIVISDAAVVYKAEAFYGDVITVEVTPAEWVRKGCDFYYRLTQRETGKEVARAKTGIVFLDYNTRKTTSVPERFRSALTLPEGLPIQTASTAERKKRSP